MSENTSKSNILRPSPYVENLVKQLAPASVVKMIQPRRRLHIYISGVNYCYLLIEGRITVHRAKDDLILGTVAAPSIMGITPTETHQVSSYVKTLVPCKIGIMTRERALQLIGEKGLWEDLSQHLMVMVSKIFSYSEIITATSTYEIIKLQLEILMEEDRSIRENTTIENYISSRVPISRSSIMRVLTALRNSGYIDIDRGVLIAVHSLPDRV